MMIHKLKPNQKLRIRKKKIVVMRKKMTKKRTFRHKPKTHFKQGPDSEEIRMECSIIIRTTLSYEIKSMSKKVDTKICLIRLMKNFKTTVSSNKLSR